MRRFLHLLVALLSVATVSMAQGVSFRVNSPKAVAVGEGFRVEFELNATPDRGSFVEPAFEGLEVSAGPATSQSSSFSSINGKMEQSVSYSYTYVVYATSEGEYTIGPARVKVDGKEYSTEPQKIKAIKENASSSGGNKNPSASADNTPKLADDDILLLVTLDHSTVYVGQPVVVTYKLLSRVNMAIEGQKMPSFAGFWANRLNTGSARWIREEYQGKLYDACPVAEYLLFPQQEGELKIDPMELSVVAQIPVKNNSRHRDPFAEFMGMPTVQEVYRRVVSQTPTLDVRALPEGAPESFAGAVGEFKMTVAPLSDKIDANSAFTYSVRIAGEGNFSMIQTPHLPLPAVFEQYPAKSSESIQTTARGVSGYRQFEYPIIARAEGDYVIPALEFTYFNPTLAKYVTLTSPEFPVTVAPDSSSKGGGPVVIGGGGVNKEDIMILGDDIRFIKLDDADLKPSGKVFMFSGTYFLIVVLMLILCGLLYVWLSRYLRQMRNQATLKGKRANRVALARFRMAERYMKESNERGFYEEMLRGLWGYLSDKLNIPASDLTKENMRERLIQRGVSAEDVEQYVGLITECEYAQYSPSGSGRMADSYLKGVTLISRLEAVINK